MEFNDNQDLHAAPGSQDVPVHDQSNPTPSGVYRGAGVGQKESPFANSPYQAYHQRPAEPQGDAQSGSSTQPPRQDATQPQAAPKATKVKSGHKGAKRLLAAVLAIALVAGACGITAGLVNRRWEEETEQLSDEFESKISDLQSQIQALERSQTVVSTDSQQNVTTIIPSTTMGLTPSQVYSMNVNSVVAISNQSTTNIWGQVSETASSGSGFVLSEDGYIVSNYHVVEGATKLTVITYMGDEYEATLVGYDEMNDVSILKIDAQGLTPVTIGDSDALIVGDQVVAIGNPLGELTSSLTVGYISAKDRTINTDGNLINMMQTDAAINPGNSGGPLFNMQGEVIGITTAKYSGSTTSGASIEGIGFAIPINDVMNMSEDLMTHGYRTNQAYLGVSVMDLPSSTADMYTLPAGSYVRDVVAGSCAETAGIVPKDIIIAIGDYEVDGNTTLSAALRKFSAGDTTTITVWRDSLAQELELTITFDERPQDPNAEQAADPEMPGEMPSSGSYEEWYNYFAPFFGSGNG